jgi:CheY-like chemotaxis protein
MPLAAKTILIVDDERMVVQILEDVLGEAGYQTLSARHGDEALAIIATTRPDLVLTDLLMPVRDGFGLCRAILANPATRAIPLVLMSAVVDLRASIDFPYAGFLVKPFEINILLGTIAGLIGMPASAVFDG